jgi:MFS family permease
MSEPPRGRDDPASPTPAGSSSPAGANAAPGRAKRWLHALERREHEVAHRTAVALGGRARARVIIVWAAALALDAADKATVSATAVNLRDAFGINNTQIGLLITAVAITGALATIPIGVLTDRNRRTRLLAASILLWVAATLVSAAAQSYVWLLVSRLALGAVAATSGPTVTSLTGDFFPAAARGRMWGYILSGELIGTGIGFIVSGEIAAFVSWRAAFAWLAIPGLALAWLLFRLPEPARGGQSKLALGQTRILDEREVDEREDAADDADRTDSTGNGGDDASAQQAVAADHVQPDPRLVVHGDPRRRSLWWAIRYVLTVRTNLVLIVASALGYFFFEGLRSFALLFATSHYNLSQAQASPLVLVVGIGALAGVVLSGRLADRLLRRGRVRARVLVPTVCLLALTPVLAPAIVTTSLAVALPLLVLGGLLLGAVNPPLDAARLDIMPPLLWGRAESVRTFLRRGCEAAAPTVFGLISASVFVGSNRLAYTFLVFQVAVLAAGLLGLAALRTYPRDVATAAASSESEPEGE